MNDLQATLDPRNFVNIGPHGTFKRSGELQSTPDDILALFADLRAGGTDHLVVHFHGGLISEGEGKNIAERMIAVYSETKAHPVCFIWETGLAEIIRNNLLDIHDTKLFKRLIVLLAKKLAKYLGVQVGARGAGLEPDTADVEAELAKPRPFDDLDRAQPTGAKGGALPPPAVLEQQARVELEMELAADPELAGMLQRRDQGAERLRDGPAGTGARGPISLATAAAAMARVLARSLGRWMKGHDHGFYPTLVEEVLRELYLDDFGAWVWSGMKTAAEQMWLPNGAELDADSHPGTLFLEQLAALQRERPGFVVDLVGHSAGSIAIAHLLKANAERGIGAHIRNIMLLAPAARSDLFHAEITSHPERFERLRVFTMSDDYERRDMLVPHVYTRSLLYFIAGVLEPDQVDCPVSGMQRYLSAEPPYDDGMLVDISGWLNEEGKDRLVFSVTGADAPPGHRSESRTHGDFDDDPATRASLCQMIDA